MKGIKIGSGQRDRVKFGVVYALAEEQSLIVRVEDHIAGYKREGEFIRHTYLEDATHVIDLPEK